MDLSAKIRQFFTIIKLRLLVLKLCWKLKIYESTVIKNACIVIFHLKFSRPGFVLGQDGLNLWTYLCWWWQCFY